MLSQKRYEFLICVFLPLFFRNRVLHENCGVNICPLNVPPIPSTFSANLFTFHLPVGEMGRSKSGEKRPRTKMAQRLLSYAQGKAFLRLRNDLFAGDVTSNVIGVRRNHFSLLFSFFWQIRQLNESLVSLLFLQTELRSCAACGEPISDRYLLEVGGCTWHGSCLRCCVCLSPLERQTSCFLRERQVYCKTDYAK